MVAIFLSAFVLKFDWNAAVIVEKVFPVLRELILVLLFFMIPGALLANSTIPERQHLAIVA